MQDGNKKKLFSKAPPDKMQGMKDEMAAEEASESPADEAGESPAKQRKEKKMGVEKHGKALSLANALANKMSSPMPRKKK